MEQGGKAMNLTSQTTFLYVEDMARARYFFDEVIKLEVVYDPLWACVWRTGRDSFLGVVDNQSQRGLIRNPNKDSVLVSLTTEDIESAYTYLCSQDSIANITPIRFVEDIGLKSFLFHGPEGYLFEVQEFTNLELKELF